MLIKNTLKTAAAALVLAALPAVSALANDSNYPGAQASRATVSSTSRADVRSDYLQAKREGTVTQGDQRYPAAVSVQTTGKTRAEVRAELAAAHAQGRSAIVTDHNFPQNSNYPGDFAGG